MKNKEICIEIYSLDKKLTETEKVKLFYCDDGTPTIWYSDGTPMFVKHLTESIIGADKNLNLVNHTFIYYRDVMEMRCFLYKKNKPVEYWGVEEKSSIKLIELMARM